MRLEGVWKVSEMEMFKVPQKLQGVLDIIISSYQGKEKKNKTSWAMLSSN